MTFFVFMRQIDPLPPNRRQSGELVVLVHDVPGDVGLILRLHKTVQRCLSVAVDRDVLLNDETTFTVAATGAPL